MGNKNSLKSKPTSISWLIFFFFIARFEAVGWPYWNQCEFCHWSGRGQDFAHWNRSAIWMAAQTSLFQSYEQTRRTQTILRLSFGIKNPSSLLTWLLGCNPTSTALFVAVFSVAILIRDLARSYKNILLAGEISLVCWCHCENKQRTKSWRFYLGLRKLRNPQSFWQE